MSKIQILDNLTVQQIAAGEVIESPASVVKELIENSIDAKSENITVEIKKGGKEYIRITDDGEGIGEKDLNIAFLPHSTSKLRTADDLYQINSLGFRGEALSSISNVAKVEVMTKTEEAMAGFKVMVEEGEIIYKDIVGSPKGTTMIIKDLFYNLPVRREFLKSDLSESNSISDVVYKAALGNPNCSFRYIRDGKNIITTSKNNDYNNHIYSILGKEFAKNLKFVEYENELLKIEGYISNNHLYRGNRSHQYLYINGRHINNREISSTIEKRYRGLLPINRFPIFILFIDIDPTKIDVNIHPTKQEIKFSNIDEILETISQVISKGLKNEITIPKIKMNTNPKKENKSEELPLLFDLSKDNKLTKDKKLENKEDQDGNLNDFSEENNDSIIIKDLRDEKIEGSPEKEINVKYDYDIDYNSSERPEKTSNYLNDFVFETEKTEKSFEKVNVKKDSDKVIMIDETLENLEAIGVIFKTYILAEDKINEKFYIIDQHAAHERIMYERFLKDYREEKILIQQLIAPEILEMTEMEINLVEENIELFEKIGFDLGLFGPSSVIIRGVPIMFGNLNIDNLFWEILDNLNKDISSSYDIKKDKIMKIACVNSIKSGDTMDIKEIMALFDQLKECSAPWTCPHGRPTMIEMTKKDIEKEFLRIM